MFGIEHYPAFIGAILLFQLLPGAGTVAIVHAASSGGRRAGLGAVAGTLAADLVWMTAAVTGLASVMSASRVLFTALQLAGIGYLCGYGLRLLAAGPSDNNPSGAPASATFYNALWQALAVGLSNPKVIFFYLGLFPAFMGAAWSPRTLVVMIAHITFICLLYQVVLVVAGEGAARQLAGRGRVVRMIRCAAGCALIGFGVSLGFNLHLL